MPHQRPDCDDFTNVAGWRCPLCNATSYSRVTLKRPNGASYATEFYECAACSVMFRYPNRFARLGLPVHRWAADVEPRTLRDVHSLATNQGKSA
jgi:hypothetical protein